MAPNTLNAGDLGANSVGTSEVVPDSLAAADLAPSSVGASEAVDDSLQGTDIQESTLCKVPSAATADTAASAATATNASQLGGTAADFYPLAFGASKRSQDLGDKRVMGSTSGTGASTPTAATT